MAFTFDLSTDVGKVRNLIGDSNASDYFFEDASITSFLDLNSGDILLAAVQALRSMASYKAFNGKRVSAGNYSEDTTGSAKDLLAVADVLEQMAINTPADAQSEIVYNEFNFKTILQNKVLRGESID